MKQKMKKQKFELVELSSGWWVKNKFGAVAGPYTTREEIPKKYLPAQKD